MKRRIMLKEELQLSQIQSKGDLNADIKSYEIEDSSIPILKSNYLSSFDDNIRFVEVLNVLRILKHLLRIKRIDLYDDIQNICDNLFKFVRGKQVENKVNIYKLLTIFDELLYQTFYRKSAIDYNLLSHQLLAFKKSFYWLDYIDFIAKRLENNTLDDWRVLLSQIEKIN